MPNDPFTFGASNNMIGGLDPNNPFDIQFSNNINPYLFKYQFYDNPYWKYLFSQENKNKQADEYADKLQSKVQSLNTILPGTVDALGNGMMQSDNSRTKDIGLVTSTIGKNVAANVAKGITNNVSQAITNGVFRSVAKEGAKELAKKGASVVKQGAAQGLKSAFSAPGVITMAGDVASGLIGPKSEYSGSKGDITKGLDTAYDTVETALSVIPGGAPFAAIMAGSKALNSALNKWTGSGTDGMTTMDAILGSNFMPVIGWTNGWGGKKTKTIDNNNWEYNNKVDSLLSTYGSTEWDRKKAQRTANKKYGLLSGSSRKAANRVIDRYNLDRALANDIQDQNSIDYTRGYDMNELNNLRYLQDLRGTSFLLSAKNGTKIKQIIKKSKSLFNPKISDWKPTINSDLFKQEEIKEFKEGGSIIPEGALHARKNNMDVENITKKGIPVIDNNGRQQAEIERNEIIFSKEITDKIEALQKDGSDKAALEAGKILAEEILHNTEDRTGLIKEVKSQKFQQGGNLNPQEAVSTIAGSPKNLVDKAKQIIFDNYKRNFISRLLMDSPLKIDLGDGNYETHQMTWAKGKGKIWIYPEVQQVGDELIHFDGQNALNNALKNNDVIELEDTPENKKFAEWFTHNNYKQFFDSTKKAYEEAVKNNDI